MTKFPVACCRIALDSGDGEPLVRIKFNVQDKCDEDTQAPSVSHEARRRRGPEPGRPYYNKVRLTLTAADNGCAGIDTTEYRIDSGEWKSYRGPVESPRRARTPSSTAPPTRFDNVSAAGNDDLHDRRDQRLRGTADHAPDQRCRTAGRATRRRSTLRLDAADPAGGGESSGVKSTEYTINGATPMKLAPGDLPRTLVLDAQRRVHDRVPLGRLRRQRRSRPSRWHSRSRTASSSCPARAPDPTASDGRAEPGVGDPAPGARPAAPAGRPAVHRRARAHARVSPNGP